MDIYGFPAYQYYQSDELAKQMYEQQALTTSMPFHRGANDPHVMPVPTGTPWNMQGIGWGTQQPPQLVQFTGQLPQCEPTVAPLLHCKRKSLDVEPAIPSKQLITEEKMAAHLNSLHISSDFTTHSLAAEEGMDVVGLEGQSTSSASITNRLKGHKIVLSEEIKKLQEEPLLPAALIERLEKPQMSLVVWKPRDNILDKIKEVEDEKNTKSDLVEHSKQRHGVLVTELSAGAGDAGRRENSLLPASPTPANI